MISRMMKASIAATVMLGLMAADAVAWGPLSQRVIASTALQMIRRTHREAFKSSTGTYDEDVLRGATAFPGSLSRTGTFTSDQAAILAVGEEVQLLRKAREYGIGSFMSYRMGVLSALVADIMMPYGIALPSDPPQLKKQIETDVDAHIANYTFSPSGEALVYVLEFERYFNDRRHFIANDTRVIGDDYMRGKKYNGFLRDGAEVYFRRSVEAVADVWNSVLRVKGA